MALVKHQVQQAPWWCWKAPWWSNGPSQSPAWWPKSWPITEKSGNPFSSLGGLHGLTFGLQDTLTLCAVFMTCWSWPGVGNPKPGLQSGYKDGFDTGGKSWGWQVFSPKSLRVDVPWKISQAFLCSEFQGATSCRVWDSCCVEFTIFFGQAAAKSEVRDPRWSVVFWCFLISLDFKTNFLDMSLNHQIGWWHLNHFDVI